MIGNRNPILYRENSALLSMEFNHCGFQQCTPGYQYGISMRPFHLIHFVLEGKGCLVMGEKKYEVEKGHAFYIPAGMPGYYTADRKDPWKYAWIGVYADVRNPYLKLIFQEKSVVPVALPQDVLEKALLAIIAVTDRRAADVETYRKEEFPGEQFFAVRTPQESLEINSRMLHLFSLLVESQTQNSFSCMEERNHAADAKAYMDACYYENIKVQDIAESLHIHPNYLTQVFREAYGQTPKMYLNQLRMYRAGIMLVETDYPVSVVAEAVGFSNPFHFSAAFKEHYHMSPANYRKENQ